MSIPVRKSLGIKPNLLRLAVQTKNVRDELLIDPHANQCYRFPYFIKGVPPRWKNPPPSVDMFDPFSTLKFRLKLRMLDKKRRK